MVVATPVDPPAKRCQGSSPTPASHSRPSTPCIDHRPPDPGRSPHQLVLPIVNATARSRLRHRLHLRSPLPRPPSPAWTPPISHCPHPLGASCSTFRPCHRCRQHVSNVGNSVARP
ncbi:hypothetical protein ACLOJK_006558 [Asimina triloba]